MMEQTDYQMIFKRKSFHRFTGAHHLTNQELQEIQNQMQGLRPLINGIQTAFRLVPCEQTSCRRGEYCILVYSEVKERYLCNAGYMAEQLDLWLASKNIGACWYGMGKANETKYHGLDFVIMIAIEKCEERQFRKDYTKAKRKSIDEIWEGNEDGYKYREIISAARYAPSACNTQPWKVKAEGSKLHLYQVKGRRGIMPANKIIYYNAIDMGIFMLFLELCLSHEKLSFKAELHPETPFEGGRQLIATYSLEML